MEYVSGVQEGVDFDAVYRVPGMPGVAWRLLGWEPRWEPFIDVETGEECVLGEGEWVPDVGGQVGARMVGDDRVFYFDPAELVKIEEEDFCPVCGQIGCEGWRW
jgi:hypothetical protein